MTLGAQNHFLRHRADTSKSVKGQGSLCISNFHLELRGVARVRENPIELQLVIFGDIRQIYQPKKVSSNVPMLHPKVLQYRTGWDMEAIFCISSTMESSSQFYADVGNCMNCGFNMYACQTY